MPEVHARRLSDYVNTLRGSDSNPDFSYGNTFPAVALPFGFNFWTPITEADSDSWLYNYASSTIKGFAVSHEPSPWIEDHGSIQVMPMSGQLRLSAQDRASTFNHLSEIAQAHYYRVALGTDGITTEITPTDHASVFRFTFSKAGEAYILFDSIASVSGSVSIASDKHEIQGYVDHNGPRLYFIARVDKPITASASQPGSRATGWIEMLVQANQAVAMSMATSFISVDQARSNLDQEVGGKTFDQIKEAAAGVWDDILGKIEIEGATDDQNVTFYSNLYRAFLYPNSMGENVGGTSEYFSPYTERELPGEIYVNGGFWDTYRAAWPLYDLLVPTQAGKMLEGFVTDTKTEAGRRDGRVPVTLIHGWVAFGYCFCRRVPTRRHRLRHQHRL